MNAGSENPKPRIVLCYPVGPDHIQRIEKVADGYEVIDAGQEHVAEQLLEADIFCGHAKVPVPWAEVIRRGRLQWIQSSAAGLDHCLVPEVIESPVEVTGASGLFAVQVAEQTMALLLGLIRRMHVFFLAQERRQFMRRPTDDLHGKTVGIVGFGGNGRQIAHVLQPFGVRIVATDVFAQTEPAYVEYLWPAEELDRLLAISDIVILCVPLNATTYHLMDASRLSRMKAGSYLVNVARGPVVDERALVDALQRQHILAAALDVTEQEPLAEDSPLWSLPNVLITPHVGAQSADRVDVTTDLFVENLRRRALGQPLINLVDKRLGFPRPENHLYTMHLDTMLREKQ